MIIILLSLGIFLGYIGWMIKKNGIPENISSTYYQGGKFSIMMALSGILLLTQLGEPWWLAFIMIGSIILVGCAPRFKGIELKIHFIAALLAAVSSQAWILLGKDSWWLIFGLVIFPWYLSKKNWLFWAEMICFLEIYTNEVLKQI